MKSLHYDDHSIPCYPFTRRLKCSLEFSKEHCVYRHYTKQKFRLVDALIYLILYLPTPHGQPVAFFIKFSHNSMVAFRSIRLLAGD